MHGRAGPTAAGIVRQAVLGCSLGVYRLPCSRLRVIQRRSPLSLTTVLNPSAPLVLCVTVDADTRNCTYVEQNAHPASDFYYDTARVDLTKASVQDTAQ